MDLEVADIIPQKIVTCTIEGIVEADDLRILTLPAEVFEGSRQAAAAAPSPYVPEADDPNDLKKVREKHHSVARLIAGGMAQTLVASLSGYTASYLNVLLNNPAMQELIDHYRVQRGAAAAVVTERLKSVGLRATEKLEQRMDADQLNNQELIATAKLGLDRGGHGPSSTKHSVEEKHVIDHAQLLALRKNALEDSKEYIISVENVRAAITQKALPSPARPATYDDPDLQD